MSTTWRDSSAGTFRVPEAPERVDALWDSVTRTARAPGQSVAASPGSSTSTTWLTEVCRPPTLSPASIRPFRTCVSASAAGEPGTVVAASAPASAAVSARSRAADSPTTTLTMSAPSPSAVGETGALGGEFSDASEEAPVEGAPEREPAGACGGRRVVEVGAAPSAHAGLSDTSPLAGPQATMQAATSSTAAHPQMRTCPRPSRRPLPQRMTAGARPARFAPPGSFSSRLPEPSRGPAFDLILPPGLVPDRAPSLDPTVRVGVRAAARNDPAASRAPSGSSMGEACPSCGARATRSRAFGRSAGSFARASTRRPARRLAPVPLCPAHSISRRARAYTSEAADGGAPASRSGAAQSCVPVSITDPSRSMRTGRPSVVTRTLPAETSP